MMLSNLSIYFNFYKKINNLVISLIVLNRWLKFVSCLLRYNSFFFKTTLIDMNTFDYNKSFLLNKKSLNLNSLTYLYYNYNYNFKINIISFLNLKRSIETIENIFLGSTWLERELSELYGIFFTKKKDIRNLLLDYNFIGNPFLKKFPVCGFVEINFNFLNNFINYTKIILRESDDLNFLYS